MRFSEANSLLSLYSILFLGCANGIGFWIYKRSSATLLKKQKTSLDGLGASMQKTSNGQLGKQSSSMIARMISSKMPGGFNIAIARKYLTDRYHLQSGKQDSALMLAMTMEPAARLVTPDEIVAPNSHCDKHRCRFTTHLHHPLFIPNIANSHLPVKFLKCLLHFDGETIRDE